MDTKPWLQSKTIWGGLLAILAGVIKTSRNIDVSDLVLTIGNNLDGFLAVIGGIIAIIGRLRAKTAISSTPPLDPRSPLMKLLLLTSVLGLLTSGCTSGPVYSSSPLAAVGADFTADASAALQAYADYRAGNESLTWALQQMFNAYALSAQTSSDVKALVAAWAGRSGDGQALADRLARIFGGSTAPPETKMAALANVAQSVAQNKGA